MVTRAKVLAPKGTPRLLLTLGLFLISCRRSGPPYSPSKALETIKVQEGFRVELFASEPLIEDPVAMDWDENGRIYVAEDTGYPLDTRPVGRIVRLEDTDGDGIPHRSTVFADRLVMPNGVMYWNGGLLVTAAPDVWFFKDTTGSGRADIREKVLTGFAFTNPQHMVNGPLYGLDNWIYLAHQGAINTVIFKREFGDRGGDIRFANDASPRLKMGTFDVRFRPGTHELEALSEWSQFGQAFDEWGHHFTITNTSNGRHVVIAGRYLQRNPDLLVSSTMQDVSTLDNNKVYAITHNPRFEILTDIGTLTSSCSITFPYLGGAFPADFQRVGCIAEPAHNMVHCDVWSDSGATYTAKRLREGTEFLASTDAWFRPVNLYIGPDGALYMIDYYRKVIEHPEWMASSTYHSEDLYSGADKGRIYRIVPDTQPPLPRPTDIHLGRASDSELVQQLGNPNIWWRRTAQRLLVERHHDDAAGPLTKFIERSTSPLARLHALWTLEGLGKLDTVWVEKSLDDPEPGVRENAIRLAEPRLKSDPALVRRLLKMTEDRNSKVRFQLLSTLGFIDSPQANTAEDRLLLSDIEDPWVQLAALSVASPRAPQYFRMAVSRLSERQTEGRTGFFERACSVIGMRQNSQEIRGVLAAIAGVRHPGTEWWRAASLEGLAQGCQAKQTVARETLKASQNLLLGMFENSPPAVRRASLRLLGVAGLPKNATATRITKRAETNATDRRTDPAARADAVGLLALEGPVTHQALFERLIGPQEPDQVQIAALRALRPIKGADIGHLVLARWRPMSPEVRSEAMRVLLQEPDRVRLLLKAVSVGEVQPWQLNSFKPRLFMDHDPEIRDMARALLEETPAAREEVLRRYQAALELKGDSARGKEVFRRVCSKCHELEGMGTAVGPNLGTVRNHPVSQLLVDILVPSKSIESGYETYVVERSSGEMVDGIMSAHTAATITLRQENGREFVISRQDIKEMRVSNVSMMPDGLEKQIDLQQMADLLGFLKALR